MINLLNNYPTNASVDNMPHAISPENDETMEDMEITSAPLATPDDNDEMDTSEPPASSPPTMPTASAPTTTATSLDDLFDDDDDDDEFSTSIPTQPSQQQPVAAGPSKGQFSDPTTLRQFYSRLFPFRPLFQWLNHSATPSPDFQNREFAFVLPGGAYIRYQSFHTADLFRKQCIQMTPERFEIGPQYTINPRDRKQVRNASSFRPVMKELVFDIDMTDYDPIRTCCQGASICNKCWGFITMAIRVVDVALREDFGFKHILWVYSGRRGAHAWISDLRARSMDDAKRRAIANYLVLITGNEQGKRMSVKRPLHPHIDRSLKILNPFFSDDVLVEQDPWATEKQAEKLLERLPDTKLKDALLKKWDSMPGRSSAQKWADIDALAETGNLSTLTPKSLVDVKQDIRLEYSYPRLDAEVSKKLNHLLKSPFVVHPGTGRVCVPIDVRDLEAFDPLAVPKVTDLLEEIDRWDAEKGKTMEEAERAKVADWQKTRLKPYVEYFRGYVAGLLKEESKGKRGREEDVGGGVGESMEF